MQRTLRGADGRAPSELLALMHLASWPYVDLNYRKGDGAVVGECLQTLICAAIFAIMGIAGRSFLSHGRRRACAELRGASGLYCMCVVCPVTVMLMFVVT